MHDTLRQGKLLTNFNEEIIQLIQEWDFTQPSFH